MMTAANTVAYAFGAKEEMQGTGVFSGFKLKKDDPTDRAISVAITAVVFGLGGYAALGA